MARTKGTTNRMSALRALVAADWAYGSISNLGDAEEIAKYDQGAAERRAAFVEKLAASRDQRERLALADLDYRMQRVRLTVSGIPDAVSTGDELVYWAREEIEKVEAAEKAAAEKAAAEKTSIDDEVEDTYLG